MSNDETCRVCGAKRSAHVDTWRGPQTCPKVASGEGTYVLVESGIIGGGLRCDDQPYERYEFRSARSPLNFHPTGDGSGR